MAGGKGLDDVAYEARQRLLADPARPSTTPFLDAESGMMTPLVPFGPDPGRSLTPMYDQSRYPRPYERDANRPPEAPPKAGGEQTLFGFPHGGILKSMVPWAQGLSDAATSAARFFTRDPNATADYATDDYAPAPLVTGEQPRDIQGGWDVVADDLRRFFNRGGPVTADPKGEMQGPPLPPAEMQGPPDSLAIAARDAAVPKNLVIGRPPTSAGSAATTPGASPGASSSPAPAAVAAAELTLPTPPQPVGYATTAGDDAKAAAQDAALLRAGLAMMASNNPSFFGVLGEGGLAGLDVYEKALNQSVASAREQAEFEAKQQQQAFENEIANLSTQLAFAKDAREARLLEAKLAQIARLARRGGGSGGPSERYPKNRYEFYLMGRDAEVAALARKSPTGTIPPEQFEAIDSKWLDRAQRIHASGADDSFTAVTETTGEPRIPIEERALQLLREGS